MWWRGNCRGLASDPSTMLRMVPLPMLHMGRISVVHKTSYFPERRLSTVFSAVSEAES